MLIAIILLTICPDRYILILCTLHGNRIYFEEDTFLKSIHLDKDEKLGRTKQKIVHWLVHLLLLLLILRRTFGRFLWKQETEPFCTEYHVSELAHWNLIKYKCIINNIILITKFLLSWLNSMLRKSSRDCFYLDFLSFKIWFYLEFSTYLMSVVLWFYLSFTNL